jgi:hypothetical protein
MNENTSEVGKTRVENVVPAKVLMGGASNQPSTKEPVSRFEVMQINAKLWIPLHGGEQGAGTSRVEA